MGKKKSGFLKEFKEFAMKGNMLDLAVGVIVGGAFKTVVDALTNSVIMPVVSMFLGGLSFEEWKIRLPQFFGEKLDENGEVIVNYLRFGDFLSAFINFVIMAFVVFLIVKTVNRLREAGEKHRKKEAEAPAAPSEPTKEEQLLTEIRDLLNEYEFPGDDTPIIKGSALNALISESTDPNAPEYACIKELMDAVDTYIPNPDREEDKPFLMPIEDVMTISGRGTVATGRVERGVAKVGDAMEIVGIKPDRLSTTITGLEMFRKSLDFAEAGDNIGALLRGVDRTQIERGQVLAKPGSVHPHKVFESQVYVLTKDEGGRHTPFFSNYRPQFYFRTTDVTGIITLPEGTEMCMPGDNVMMHVELLTPVAMEEGLRFAIREGGRTVGSGVVGKIIE